MISGSLLLLMENIHVLYNIFRFIDWDGCRWLWDEDEVYIGRPFDICQLVCKCWYKIIMDINQMMLIFNPEYYNDGGVYGSLLAKTKIPPTHRTVGLMLSHPYVKDRYFDLYINTYNRSTWRHMPLPILGDIEKYHDVFISSSNHRKSAIYTDVLDRITSSANNDTFSYTYSLITKSNINVSLYFERICGNMSFSNKFILWILRDRPSSIVITISGIVNLIKRGFPANYIRDIVLNPSKYNMTYYCDGDDTEYAYDKFGEKHEDLQILAVKIICVAWKAYLDKILFRDNYTESDCEELTLYHRLVPSYKVKSCLLWFLNGYDKKVKEIQIIESIIKQTVDIKPYSTYLCFDWYNTDRPYTFMKDR